MLDPRLNNRIFRMDYESWALIEQAASADGQTVSSFVRDTLLKAAKRQLKAG